MTSRPAQSLRQNSSSSAPSNATMRLINVRHPIIDLISYSILISWVVFWGMVVGGMFEQEILRPRAEVLDKHPPTPDHSPSPEVFPGIG